MATARIDIRGQGFTGTYSKNGDLTIDRTFPGLLSNEISEFEWRTFCDRIDEVLLPLTAVKKKIRKFYCGYILFSVGFGIAFVILVSTGIFFNLIGTNVIILYPLLMAVFFIPFIAYFVMARNMVFKVKEILADVQRLCDEESAKRSNVSFHVREERVLSHRSHVILNYIEVSVGTTMNSTINYPLLGADAPLGVGKSTAERLRELEGIKALISEEEYNEKRNAILATV